MTIPYDDSLVGIFFHWKASVWKLLWKEVILFLVLYATISILYRFGLNYDQQGMFDKLAVDFESYTNRFIPISFLLGFYVTSMLNRWWDQFRLMGWPDPLMGSINLCFPGCSPEVIQQRRAYAKYLLLSTVLGWRLISVRVMKRFPTIDHVSEAGLMTKEEQKLIESKPREVQWTTPLFWIQRGIADAVTLGKLGAPIATSAQSTLNDYIMSFRKLICYEWVNIPLVYTQVVAMSVYSYFACTLVSRQFSTRPVDYYFPLFTVLQLFVYMGWFKVGQHIMKPFGEDDEDFEMNYLIDRHYEVIFAMADGMSADLPPIDPDVDSNMNAEKPMPYTEAALRVSLPPTTELLKKDIPGAATNPSFRFVDSEGIKASQESLASIQRFFKPHRRVRSNRSSVKWDSMEVIENGDLKRSNWRLSLPPQIEEATTSSATLIEKESAKGFFIGSSLAATTIEEEES